MASKNRVSKTAKLSRSKISGNVIALGLVSFFNDIASEMIYPIVPIFLTTTLGAPVAFVGLVEGIAESTASILKMISGWLSDKWRTRKPFIVSGYSLSAISKVMLGLAGSWGIVLFARFTDRFGKGVRTSPRDALITESSTRYARGQSFGFHRTLDTLGAVVGPLLGLWALTALDNNYRLIFLVAFIPGFVGIILLLAAVREKRQKQTPPSVSLKWKGLDRSFKQFIFVSVIFALGNSSDAFLILRAKDLGLSVPLVVFAYVLFNLAYAVFSYPAGVVSDKIGPRKLLSVGFVLFAVVYVLFGVISKSIFLWLLFPLYGFYMALTEGVGKAYISNLVAKENSGTAFGIYQTATGICIFAASFIAGLLWTYGGVSAPFIYGAVLSIIAAGIFLLGNHVSRIGMRGSGKFSTPQTTKPPARH